MSDSESFIRGGQPSITQPIAGPCDSPNVVTVIESAEGVAGHARSLLHRMLLPESERGGINDRRVRTAVWLFPSFR
jgi:hypothetical protein